MNTLFKKAGCKGRERQGEARLGDRLKGLFMYFLGRREASERSDVDWKVPAEWGNFEDTGWDQEYSGKD